MCKVVYQFYVDKVNASFIKLSENMPFAKFTKVKIGDEIRNVVPFAINFTSPSFEDLARNLAIEGGGNLVGKSVERAVHYELLFCFAGKPNFLQKSKKEITLLFSHGYKGQRVNNNILILRRNTLWQRKM